MRRNHGQLCIPFIIDNKFFDQVWSSSNLWLQNGLITPGARARISSDQNYVGTGWVWTITEAGNTFTTAFLER